MGLMDTLPPILVVVLLIVVVFFVIKSLFKFAIIVGAIALVLWALWQFDIIPFSAVG